MKTILSRDNPLYKELKHLASSSQVQRKLGRSLLEGVHLCEAYLLRIGMPSHCVVGESALHHPEVAALLARCCNGGNGGNVCVMLPDALYRGLSQVENGVEILFVIDTPRAVSKRALQDAAVLLDNVQDPGNLGSILRSAAAAGIGEIYCSPGTAFAWSPKVLRAGMGAHFLLAIAENADLHALIRSAALPVVATSPHAQHTVYQIDLKRPVAWLFGHEGQGVAAELSAAATHLISIPHVREIESLNVAACAAVCFFEQMRQRTT